MKELGFEQLKSKTRIFSYYQIGTNNIIGIVYIDNTFFYGPDKVLLNEIKAKFMKKWEYRDLGELSEFLQMCIIYQDQKIFIDQTDYLKKILQYFQMENACPAPTPLLAENYLQKHEGLVDSHLQKCFQTIIGSFLYLMLGTCPDIAFTIIQLTRHTVNPSQDHLNKALYIYHYLART